MCDLDPDSEMYARIAVACLVMAAVVAAVMVFRELMGAP